MANIKRRLRGIKSQAPRPRPFLSQPGNDINQENESGPGWATAATSPRLLKTGGPRRANLGMTGPNNVRYTPLAFAASTTNKQLALPGNRWRAYLMIQNNSLGTIYVGFGVQVAQDNVNGFVIAAGGFYEMDTKPPFNNIYIKGDLAANQNAVLIEGIYTLE